MCKHGTLQQILLNGKVETIDSCIASLVARLNKGGAKSWVSCCGHNRYGGYGSIQLNDGRVLLIVNGKSFNEDQVRMFLRMAFLAFSYPLKTKLGIRIRNLRWNLSTDRMRKKRDKKSEDAMNKRIEIKGDGWKAKPIRRQEERLWLKEFK